VQKGPDGTEDVLDVVVIDIELVVGALEKDVEAHGYEPVENPSSAITAGQYP
jgi:histidyl-tRNA synthetase